jgi:outer membrane receptor protein involved in Fe transport
MGGTFVITTSQPDLNEFEARGRAYGYDMQNGDDSWGGDATISVPIVQDRLGLRVTGGYHDLSGLAESPDFPGDENIDPYHRWNTRAKLLWQPSDDVSVTTTYWHTEEHRDFSPGIYGSADPPLILGTGGIVGIVDQETDLASVLVDWDTSYGRLTSATSLVDNQGLFDSTFAFDTFIPGLGNINAVLLLTAPWEA